MKLSTLNFDCASRKMETMVKRFTKLEIESILLHVEQLLPLVLEKDLEGLASTQATLCKNFKAKRNEYVALQVV